MLCKFKKDNKTNLSYMNIKNLLISFLKSVKIYFGRIFLSGTHNRRKELSEY